MSSNLRISIWLTVAVLCAIGFVVGGINAVTFGFLINPLIHEFGWSDAVTSTLASIGALTGLVLSPLAGLAVDRWGPRKVIFSGILAASVGMMIASRASAFPQMMIGVFTSAAGYCASCYIPSAVVITTRLPPQYRGFGMGLVMGATSCGAAAFSAFLGWWLPFHYWRSVMQLLAIIVAMTLPLVVIIAKGDDERRAASSMVSDGLLEKLRVLTTSTFLLGAASCGFFAFGMGAVYYHVIPILLRAGFSSKTSALLLSATWLLSALGSFVIGFFTERAGARTILIYSLALCGMGTLFLVGAGTSTAGLCAAFLFVGLWGATSNAAFQLTPVVFAERLESNALGELVGIQSAAAGILGASAPVVTGALFDQWGTYRLAIVASAIAMFLAAAFIVGISKRTLSVARPSIGA